MITLRDMMGTSTPQSVRRLALHIGLNKHTVWRWRMLTFSIIGKAPLFGHRGGGRDASAGVAQGVAGVGQTLR